MHFLIGFAILAAIIWLAFGARTARAFVGVALVIVAAAFLYVMFRIVSGTI